LHYTAPIPYNIFGSRVGLAVNANDPNAATHSGGGEAPLHHKLDSPTDARMRHNLSNFAANMFMFEAAYTLIMSADKRGSYSTRICCQFVGTLYFTTAGRRAGVLHRIDGAT
jgi:hypothetical protein